MKRSFIEAFGAEPYFQAKMHKKLCGINAINNCFNNQVITVAIMNQEILSMEIIANIFYGMNYTSHIKVFMLH